MKIDTFSINTLVICNVGANIMNTKLKKTPIKIITFCGDGIFLIHIRSWLKEIFDWFYNFREISIENFDSLLGGGPIGPSHIRSNVGRILGCLKFKMNRMHIQIL